MFLTLTGCGSEENTDRHLGGQDVFPEEATTRHPTSRNGGFEGENCTHVLWFFVF